jgi:hypothetical protein
MSNKATECADDDVDVVVPKMKAISKPKNLKKRKRDLDDQGEDEDPNKKPKSEEHTEKEVKCAESAAKRRTESQKNRTECYLAPHHRDSSFSRFPSQLVTRMSIHMLIGPVLTPFS